MIELQEADQQSVILARKVWSKLPKKDPQLLFSVLSHVMTMFIMGFHPDRRRYVLDQWIEGQRKIWDIYEAEDEAEGKTQQ